MKAIRMFFSGDPSAISFSFSSSLMLGSGLSVPDVQSFLMFAWLDAYITSSLCVPKPSHKVVPICRLLAVDIDLSLDDHILCSPFFFDNVPVPDERT